MDRRITWRVLLLWVCCLGSLVGCSPAVVDSSLSRDEAIFRNQPPDTPADVQEQLVLVNVRYYGFDQKLHRGQVVVNQDLAEDVKKAFKVIRENRFPVESVMPIAHPTIQLKGPYGLSPDTNNTSAYVWRPIVGSRKVSLHGLGLAIDINPRLNPYEKGDLVLPPGAVHDPEKAGTLTSDSEVVLTFKQMGWEWGGEWSAKGKVDYMHFQKIPQRLEPWVESYRQ